MSIGYKLKYYRKNNMLSQSELSKITGIAQTTISDLEKDKYMPKVDTLCKLAQALDVDILKIIQEGGIYE
ncbi:helix-turn-helix domain-containing protein [Clostridioides difficile]|uniref:helix-turn-helix domain-containing protein n=1 Tax=Clostridioides difficile TaxID=1496 RepID=UPI0002D4D9E4|nr:helix-turn-helix transcriptional regulator [Clostridioides difficile]DAN94405.1 MAG TPA: helix-turn-helix domain protein [Bacteriophage sp.]EGT3655157.1 XRE family transcriptional regulator [Clostridioides difficile]EGT3840207.1 XRE family transcriptional regulator [Clostridioides difficile]EGT4172059.1 XRE family transcriptional regulator [Clostridioides difficile]EGT4537432.1 XRE family transcriptional regulator [Clostridioides difficile]